MEFLKKNKDEALSANLTTRPHANINYKSIKSVLGGGMMHSIAVGEMSWYNIERLQAIHSAMTMKWYSKSVAWVKVKQPWVQSAR